jgi:hypothetical protein
MAEAKKRDPRGGWQGNENSIAALKKVAEKRRSGEYKAEKKAKGDEISKAIDKMFAGDAVDWHALVKDALIKVGKEKGEDLFTNMVKRAYKDKDIAMGLLRKLMPDLQKTMHTETRQLIVLKISEHERRDIPAHMKGFLQKEPEVTYLPAAEEEPKLEH